MEDFPSNSGKAADKGQPEPIKPVTSATAVQRKRGLGRQFKDAFIAGSGKDAFSYSVEEVIVPRLRDLMIDALQDGIERLFNGDRSVRSRSRTGPFTNNNVGPTVNYAGAYSSSQPTPKSTPRTISRAARARHNFNELVIDSSRAAHEVLDQMFDIVSQYGEVSVAHLYALTNIEPSHTDMKWGWTDLTGSRPVPDRRSGGYVLKLPQPQELHR